MSFQSEMRKIAADADRAFPDNTNKAVQQAGKLIRKLTGFKEFVNDFIQREIRDLIHTARHESNVRVKRDCGAYGGPAKVAVGKSHAVEKVYETIYDLRIAGKLLGDAFGRDLPDMEAWERATGNGHLTNAELVATLIPMVPGDKQVKEVVSLAEARRLGKHFFGKHTKAKMKVA